MIRYLSRHFFSKMKSYPLQVQDKVDIYNAVHLELKGQINEEALK